MLGLTSVQSFSLISTQLFKPSRHLFSKRESFSTLNVKYFCSLFHFFAVSTLILNGQIQIKTLVLITKNLFSYKLLFLSNSLVFAAIFLPVWFRVSSGDKNKVVPSGIGSNGNNSNNNNNNNNNGNSNEAAFFNCNNCPFLRRVQVRPIILPIKQVGKTVGKRIM